MATKLYFHDAASPDTGTLPSGDGYANGGGSSINHVTGAGTNRDATPSIGVSQTSIVMTTQAITTSQESLLRRFLSRPLAAQTIPSQSITAGLAIASSNLSSNFFTNGIEAGIWRPSTGAYIATLWASGPFLLGTAVGENTLAATEQWFTSGAETSASRDVLDGDILVFGVWRDATVQGMGTSYTNTFYYDGTTEGSATSAASYINFPTTLTFFTPAKSQVVNPSKKLKKSLLAA